MSILLVLLLIAVMFLLTSAAVILVVGPLILLQPNLRTRQWYSTFTRWLEPRDAGLPQEDITIVTRDGLNLSSWLVKQPASARGTILYLHGVGDCKIGGVPYAKLFFEKGLNVFLYDSRRHGMSEGAYCTYGFYEKHDLSTVIDYLESRRDVDLGKIGVFGTSMGAAVALQAAPIDDRITAIVAEAGFTDLRTIMVDYQKRIIKLPWHFLRNVAMSRSQKIARFKAREVSPLNAVKQVRKPILFIHGTDDSHIKADYSKALYENANEPKELLVIPKGNHSDLLRVGGTEYERTIMTFFEKYLS
ncbi:MAG: alpha/beta fold hydrolase [Ignavibacteria bacterium]|nr:alpha/beta fold hydrolase [Ignavibacteria bacterium]